MELAYHNPPNLPGFLRKDVYKHAFTQHTEEKKTLISELEDNPERFLDVEWKLEAEPLVVWGSHDELFPLSVGETLAQGLGADLVVLDQTNHAPNIEDAKGFNKAVGDFLDREE